MSLLLLLGDGITGATATEPEVRCQIDLVTPQSPTNDEPTSATVDVTDDLMSFSFTRGKQRELDRFQAARGSITLRNDDRKYDPTFSEKTALHASGFGEAVAVTPSGPSILGDLDLRIRMAAVTYFDASDDYGLVGVGRGFNFFLDRDSFDPSTLIFSYFDSNDDFWSFESSAVPSWDDGTEHWVRVTFDIDNGSSQQVATFYWSDDYNFDTQTGTWTQIGSPVTDILGSGVIRWITNDPMYIGNGAEYDSFNDENDIFALFDGFIFQAEVRDGINGTIVANPDFTRNPWFDIGGTDQVGDTHPDSLGNPWTLYDAHIDYNGDEASEDILDSGEWPFSLYIGNIKPQRRIRIPVNYAGVTHMLIEGYIDSWDQVRRGPHTGDAVVQFTDGFKVLNKANLESSAYVTEVLADNPVSFWRLDEPSTTTQAYDFVGDLHLDIVGTPEFGEQSIVSREPGTSVLMTSTGSPFQQIRKQVFGELPCSGPPMTLEIVFQRTVDGADGALIGQTCTSLTNGLFALLTSSTVVAAMTVNGVNGQLLATSTGVNFDDNLIHHVVARWDSDGSIRIFVDGVNVTNGTPSNTPTAFSDTSGYVGIGLDVFSDVDTGNYQMAAIYNTALSDARIAAHASCVSTPWNNDTPAQRVNRILDAIGWDSTRRDLDTGLSVLQSATLGMSALEHVQKVGESEFGKLFIDKHGNVELVSRNSQWNQTAVATFTDDASYVSSDPEYTDELLRNDVTVSRSEGVAQNWKDQDSIDEYLINSASFDGLYHDDDDLSLYAAQYIVDVYKDPLLRISSLTFTPNGNPSVLFPILLGMELGDWVVVEETPQNYGATTVHTCVVEGISFNWSPKVWSVTLNLSPADVRSYWAAGIEGYSNAGVSTRAAF